MLYLFVFLIALFGTIGILAGGFLVLAIFAAILNAVVGRDKL